MGLTVDEEVALDLLAEASLTHSVDGYVLTSSTAYGSGPDADGSYGRC
jgi:hypothetical protein